MEISGEYLIKIPRQQVWECLLDPNTLKACIPGCESLEKLADDNYQAQVKLTIGPVRATFQTQLSIKNAQPPKSYRLEGVGKGGAVGFGQGYAEVSLDEDENGTVLRYKSAFQVGGRLAQVGSRLVWGATRKIADDFFEKLTQHIDSSSHRLDETPKANNKTSSFIGIIVLIILAITWWLLSG